MRRVITLATALGLVGVVETFGILAVAKLVLKLDNGEIQSFIYLKLAVAGHLTLFVARTRRPFFSKPYPAPLLLGSILTTQVLAALIVGFGFLMPRIPWSYIVLIWGYCLVWVFVEDWVKLSVYRHFNLDTRRHRSFLQRIKEPLHPHGSLYGNR
jgi:H+-transporting ATPase